MKYEQHQQRHVDLHKALDELAADYIAHMPLGTGLSNSSIMDLMQWSHQQTKAPEPLPGTTDDLASHTAAGV